MTTFVDPEGSVALEDQSKTNIVPSIELKAGGRMGPIPGKVGTYCSFFLILLGVIGSIIFYAHASDLINMDSFSKGCPDNYLDSCKAVSAVLRISCALTISFGIQALGTLIFSRFYDAMWILKLLGFIALVVGLFFAPSTSFGTNGYAWFARITGFLYLILQQVILLDLAYTWNERWVALATDNEDGERGKKWLIGIIVISSILFAGGYTVIGVLYWQFNGCSDTITIITLTLVLTLLATLIQLFFSEEGSILTSAVVTAYSAYICYSAVILHPNPQCNPTLQSGYQALSAVGLYLSHRFGFGRELTCACA
jgi:hypothetical protein